MAVDRAGDRLNRWIDRAEAGDERCKRRLLGLLGRGGQRAVGTPVKGTDTTSPAGRALRASLIAASLASAPELQKKTLPPRLDRDRRSARRIAGSV